MTNPQLPETKADKNLSGIDEALDEAMQFAEGLGNHVMYGVEYGLSFVIPPTEEIINMLIDKANRFLFDQSQSRGDVREHISGRVKEIRESYRRNYDSFGKDGYLAVDSSTQIFARNMCGG